MVPVPYELLLMLQRRAGISFDSKDKTAVYVRQLGKHLHYLCYANRELINSLSNQIMLSDS